MLKWIKSRIGRVRDVAARKPARETPVPAQATILAPDSHHVRTQDISDSALKVIRRLNEAGYQAYLVGGGVRDILLDLHPKDFDVATDATPEQVRQVFRHSRIIGRRFRIVHVMFGRDTIEVTTFRGHHSNDDDGGAGEANEHGLLVRDNVYGSMAEDAVRRDFTVNALYYGADGRVHDYCNGVRDIEQRLIRMIGDPETRYREDPVRMLRAVRLAAKLRFGIEKHTAAPIRTLAPLLDSISSARLFDEMMKLLMAGHALPTFELLQEYQLFQRLFPGPARLLQPGNYTDQLIRKALHNTDERIRNDQRVTPAFLCAAMLWPLVQQKKQHLEHEGMPPHPAMQKAAQLAISEQIKRVAIPKRFTLPMQEIWELQMQLDRRQGGRAEKMLAHPRFRAAYDFLLLREAAGEALGNLGSWWTAYQEADIDVRQQMVAELNQQQNGNGARKRSRRGGRNRRKPKAE